jgi:hypothetical protein
MVNLEEIRKQYDARAATAELLAADAGFVGKAQQQ